MSNTENTKVIDVADDAAEEAAEEIKKPVKKRKGISLNKGFGKSRKSRKAGKSEQAGGGAKPKLTEKQKTVRALRRLLTKIAVVAALFVFLLTVVGSIAVCHDINMFPAVGDGDLIITYKLGGYYNGDIVLYRVDGERRIGRVVGIPGDVIDITDDANGYYTINGSQPYETIYFGTRRAPGSAVQYPYTVGEGEYFILNDLRDETYDSRMVGGVSDLKGKVVLLLRRRGF